MNRNPTLHRLSSVIAALGIIIVCLIATPSGRFTSRGDTLGTTYIISSRDGPIAGSNVKSFTVEG